MSEKSSVHEYIVEKILSFIKFYEIGSKEIQRPSVLKLGVLTKFVITSPTLCERKKVEESFLLCK